MTGYLSGLNEPQAQAVTHGEGPLMIIAGAGSGKTRVLTLRIAHLIENGVDPFRILSLTFTNKAAGEMRERIEKVVGFEARNIWMGTFHAVFAKILRIEARYLGYTSDFSIYDTDDSKSLIKSIVKELNLDDKTYKPNVVFNRISGAKNNLISADDYLANKLFRADDEAAKLPEIGRLYKAYTTRCFQANAMDFDDLLYNTNVLFRDFPEVLNKYQHKFQYVLVDEFQDTNVAQYLITRKLAAVHRNIAVVGDDAQSIYAFRGANIQNILNFEKDFPEVKVVKLEQNYRSTQTIVNAANSVIARNKAQLKKNVFTANEEGVLIDVVKASSDNEEGRLIASAIFEEKVNKGLRNTDFAILYRTNAQSRSFEEALRRQNIKYRIIGGLSFYQRKEIKDLLAYLRFVVNQSDEEAFKRIINLPKRGIGDTTVAKIAVTAAENQVPVWEVVSNITKYISGRAAMPIESFAILIKSFKLLIEEGKDAYTVAAHVAKTSGILKELYEDKTVEGLSRYENVQELLNAIKEFVDNADNEDKTISSFLQTVSLLTNADESDDGDTDRVTLMTIHGAKGLEFKNVYVVGLEEGLFPSQMMLEKREDLEEERRLFYVAITRAENKLTFSYAESRYNWGRLNMCEPSRFLYEVDQRFLTTSKGRRSGGFDDYRNNVEPTAMNFIRKPSGTSGSVQKPSSEGSPTTPASRLSSGQRPSTQATSVPQSASTDFVASDTSTLEEGNRVEHSKFGKGTVKKMDINGTDRKAVIQFDTVGEKTLLLSFAKLRILR
ncbi:ATP-dependent helicase [Runella slithyformis]|uniref:DNA 3'-5' helicase n=1 Tax=Runella slithyformis (strain ATCC 29530 / DSM 19594 / LMG 11500 / NCIMB 11436 / LSU 4) TaxID=761193 RepID=A0A7U4E678_RUNSL|nr:UvrD-helicase domain-containing protein [Runella slithyformis]AEI48914.1 UvrD/REP helicase [Runella slithyformis DSM 19594]